MSWFCFVTVNDDEKAYLKKNSMVSSLVFNSPKIEKALPRAKGGEDEGKKVRRQCCRYHAQR